MKTALYAGTFDPITNGHLDLLERALGLFDRVVVAVGRARDKNPMFTLSERIEMIQEATAGLERVEVIPLKGLLVEEAVRCEACAVIRGLRAISDFEYEFQMALMNRRLASEIETVFLTPKERFTYLDSTIVKEVALLGGDVSGLVPDVVLRKLMEKRGDS